jgi:hypothetical protein
LSFATRDISFLAAMAKTKSAVKGPVVPIREAELVRKGARLLS